MEWRKTANGWRAESKKFRGSFWNVRVNERGYFVAEHPQQRFVTKAETLSRCKRLVDSRDGTLKAPKPEWRNRPISPGLWLYLNSDGSHGTYKVPYEEAIAADSFWGDERYYGPIPEDR